MKRYHWLNKAYAGKISAADFGRWLDSLPDQNPETIVTHARDEKSAAHVLFPWDDTRAAHEYRLTLARLILGSFVIETVVGKKKGGADRIVVAPYVMRSSPGEYEITTRAMGISSKRDFILSQALAQLRRLRRRYAALSELAVVFSAIDDADARASRRKRA